MSSAPRTPSRSQPPGQASQHSRLASVPRTFKPNTFAEDASVNELLAPPPTLGHAPTTTMLPSLQSQTGYGSSSSIDLESPFSLARIAPNSTHSAHQKPPHFQHSVDTFTSPPDSSSPDIDPFKTSRTTQSPDQKPPPDRQAAEVLLAMMSSPEKGVKREDSPEQRL